MPTKHLTPPFIARCSRPSGAKREIFYWDAEERGLGLRVTYYGARNFVFQGLLQGRTLRVTLGQAADLSVEAARTEVRRMKTLVKAGIDPRTRKLKRGEQPQNLKESVTDV